jgi:hypothetical protein
MKRMQKHGSSYALFQTFTFSDHIKGLSTTKPTNRQAILKWVGGITHMGPTTHYFRQT